MPHPQSFLAGNDDARPFTCIYLRRGAANAGCRARNDNHLAFHNARHVEFLPVEL